MIVTCPECMGRLSTSAPQCPHCGFVPHFPASARGGGLALRAGLHPVLPSQEAVQKATRRVFAEWRRADRGRFVVGAILVVGALAILVGIFLLANRLNNRSARRAPGPGAVALATADAAAVPRTEWISSGRPSKSSR
jgi:hypothetical protein